MKQGSFAAQWHLAECGYPIVTCAIPRAVKRMPVIYRAHIAERIVENLTRSNDFETPAHDAPKTGTVLIFWEIKGRGEICAGAEIPRGELRPSMKIRLRIAADLSDMLKEAEG